MKTIHLLKRCLMFLLLSSFVIQTSAQRNFYHRIEVGSNNIYTFVLSNLVTGYANYFAHDMLFDNSFDYAITNASYLGRDIETKSYNPINMEPKDLFNDVYCGIKLGYQSDNMGAFNWALYASAHYKLNQFRVKWPMANDFLNEKTQYFKPGVGLVFTFGSIEQKTKVQIEGAIRYDMPIGYNGYWNNDTKMLNKGLSSHYAVKLVGYSWLSAGIYADFSHYNLYKQLDNLGNNSKFNIYNIGLTFSITPKRGEDIY